MSEAIALVCKTCGREFVLPAGELLYPCPSCGTPHSRPRATGRALADLRRAHQQRSCCDFVNAAANYQLVLNVHPDEPEALWGLALCKYGVEYVQDEHTGESLPVVHFLNRRPFTEDSDCQQAILCARAEIRPEYLQDAAYIARIQQEVLAAEKRGEAWQIFLCYKSSVPGVNDPAIHTREFAYAQELYIALRDAGYSVFFAHTTLRHAAGANYEAQIYHALQTAKVMLVVTSDPAYLFTPWVHSEWSRYLERVDAHEDSLLVPLLYDRCDPNALPNAFRNRSIQGLSMGALTAFDDLRGILAKQNVRPTLNSFASPEPGPDNNRALLRIRMAIEYGNWQKAELLTIEFLDENPDCAYAHLSLLLARRHVSDLNALAACRVPFDEDVCWSWAWRYAGTALHNEMARCLAQFAAIGQAESEAALRAAEEEASRRSAEEAARRAAAEQARREAEEAARRAAEAAARQQQIQSMSAGRHLIAAGVYHTVSLQEDGTVVAVGLNNDGRCDVTQWRDVRSVAAGVSHTVGLRADGSVVASGFNGSGRCDVAAWADVIAISAGDNHTVGLRRDGSVAAVGYNGYGQCNVSEWQDVVAIAAGATHTVGLCRDGSLVATGHNGYGQCDVGDWTDVVAIAAGIRHTLGLRRDGSVLAVGMNDDNQLDVSQWQNVVAISSNGYHTVGLRRDGSVLAVGMNDDKQCDVSQWQNVVAIASSSRHTVGLQADGAFIAVGDNQYGQCDVSGWRLRQVPRPTRPQ